MVGKNFQLTQTYWFSKTCTNSLQRLTILHFFLCQVKSIKQDSVPVSPSVPAASSAAKDTGIEDLKPEPDELLDNSDEELGILSDMIQTAQFHHPHPRSFQVR
jgi:hypothetical protein